jgi:hypothetical protein
MLLYSHVGRLKASSQWAKLFVSLCTHGKVQKQWGISSQSGCLLSLEKERRVRTQRGLLGVVYCICVTHFVSHQDLRQNTLDNIEDLKSKKVYNKKELVSSELSQSQLSRVWW